MKYTALGVDIFAGGFTIGVKKHFKVLGHLEHGPYGVKTSRLNLPDVPVHVGKENWPGFNRLQADFVYANPPCAIWSGASARRGPTWKDDPRTNCIHDVMAQLGREPRVLVWESVCNAWTRGQELLRRLADETMEKGWAVTHCLHDGQHLGLPHRRRRYFFVAHKVELKWPTAFQAPVTVRQALKGVDPGTMRPDPPKSFLVLYKRARAGNMFRHYITTAEQNKKGFSRPGFFTKKLPLDEPAYTIMHPQTFHPTEPRYLTIDEFKAVCNYPPGFKLDGGDIQQLFRAVMPSTGAWIAGIAKDGIRRNRNTPVQENFVDLRDLDNIVIKPAFRERVSI